MVRIKKLVANFFLWILIRIIDVVLRNVLLESSIEFKKLRKGKDVNKANVETNPGPTDLDDIINVMQISEIYIFEEMGAAGSISKPVVSSGRENKKAQDLTKDDDGDANENVEENEGDDQDTVNTSDDDTDVDIDDSGDEDSDPEVEDTEITEENKLELINKVKLAIEKIKSYENIFDDDGNIPEEICTAMTQLLDSYSLPDTVTSAEKAKHTSDIANLLIDKGIVEIMCSVVYLIYLDNYLQQIEGDTSEVFDVTMVGLSAFTDCSDRFCIAVCKNTMFLETLKEILTDNSDLSYLKQKQEWVNSMVETVLSILHNITMRESCVAEIRSLDIVSVLEPYLKLPKELDRLLTIASLAALTDERESKSIYADKTILEYLKKHFNTGLGKTVLQSKGWSCKELAIIIRLLARNHANNILLVEMGCLGMLVKLGNVGNTEEKKKSVKAILSMAFHEESRKTMVTDEGLGVIELPVKLKSSDNSHIRKTCEGVLWTLRLELCDSVKYKEFAPALSDKTESTDGKQDDQDDGHIMISYQWANQEKMKTIRDKLRSANYKVWMDIDEMGCGSTLQSMANAVENAKIVLICITQKYQNSSNCHLEAEYAMKKNKRIIILKLERGFEPEGWLGIISGSQYFHEFTDKYPFEPKMAELLKVLASIRDNKHRRRKLQRRITGIVPIDMTDSRKPVATTEPVRYSGKTESPASHVSNRSTPLTIEEIRNWTPEDVQKWIEKNNLKSCGLTRRTGEEIAMFIILRHESLDFFYKCLETMWKVKNAVILARIVWALKDLATQVKVNKPD